MFQGNLTAHICERHFGEHKKIMFLHSVGEDIEDIVELNSEERNKLYEEKLKEQDSA